MSVCLRTSQCCLLTLSQILHVKILSTTLKVNVSLFEDKSVLSAYTESDPACKDSLNHLKGNCQSDHMFDPTPGLYLRVCTKNSFLIS